MIEGWIYYQHALIPTCAPHKKPNVELIESGLAWSNIGGTPLFARWTTDWDCGHETNWWYVIKDTPFDKGALKSKRRYEINKGNKNYKTKRIVAEDYIQEIYEVTKKAYFTYPSKYRPHIDESFMEEIKRCWKDYSVFAAFNSEDKLCGYAYLVDYDDYSDFRVLKADPSEEKNGINAALVDCVLSEYNERLSGEDYYICDGSRAIRHQTNFQDYLEKYFGFRKSYCILHIKYRWFVRIGIFLIKPFQRIISKSQNKFAYDVSSLIEMDNCTNG